MSAKVCMKCHSLYIVCTDELWTQCEDCGGYLVTDRQYKCIQEIFRDREMLRIEKRLKKA